MFFITSVPHRMKTCPLQKELLMLFVGYCIFGFRKFYTNLLCILVQVNKTMYGNNEDVPKKLLEFFYSDSRVRDIAFAVVWNVLAADEKDSGNQLSMH